MKFILVESKENNLSSQDINEIESWFTHFGLDKRFFDTYVHNTLDLIKNYDGDTLKDKLFRYYRDMQYSPTPDECTKLVQAILDIVENAEKRSNSSASTDGQELEEFEVRWEEIGFFSKWGDEDVSGVPTLTFNGREVAQWMDWNLLLDKNNSPQRNKYTGKILRNNGKVVNLSFDKIDHMDPLGKYKTEVYEYPLRREGLFDVFPRYGIYFREGKPRGLENYSEVECLGMKWLVWDNGDTLIQKEAEPKTNILTYPPTEKLWNGLYKRGVYASHTREGVVIKGLKRK